MPTFAAIYLDPHHPKGEVDLIMDYYDLRYGDLSEGEERLKGLSASVHEGLRLNEVPGPLAKPKRALTITTSLNPPRPRKRARDRGTSMRSAFALDRTHVA